MTRKQATHWAVAASALATMVTFGYAALDAHAQTRGAHGRTRASAEPDNAPAQSHERSRGRSHTDEETQAEAPVAPSPAGVVNINTASTDELQRLPGVGPSKARAIIDLRQRAGRFRRTEDILRVRGIGRATYRRLRPMLTIEGATTFAAGGAPAGRANGAAPAAPRSRAAGHGSSH